MGVANGSAYGRGIYCSPNSRTAKGYEKGSMFICVVRDGNNIKKSGSIWVVQNECDILPLYLVDLCNWSGDTFWEDRIKPKWPYFPVSAALHRILSAKTDSP